MKNSESKPEGF